MINMMGLTFLVELGGREELLPYMLMQKKQIRFGLFSLPQLSWVLYCLGSDGSRKGGKLCNLSGRSASIMRCVD